MDPWAKFQDIKDPWSDFADATPEGVAKSQPGVLEDVGRSIVSGLGRGAIGLAGMPGDISDLALRGADWISGNESTEEQIAQRRLLPTTGELTAGYEDVTGVKFHKPQTDVGAITGAMAEGVPGGMTMGGGLLKAGRAGAGALTKQASENAAKYGAAPMGAAELAGQATEGTDIEPAARVGAAIATAAAGHSLTKPRFTPPAAASIKEEANSLYKQAKTDGVIIRSTSFDKILDDVTVSLLDRRVTKSGTPKSFGLIEELQSLKGADKDIADIDGIRQMIANAGGSLDKADTAAAMQARDVYDRLVDGLGADDVTVIGTADDLLRQKAPDLPVPARPASRDPSGALGTLKEARSLWHRARKAETVENVMTKAVDRAGANYTAAGLQTALRQELKQLKWRGRELSREFKSFSPEERRAINAVINGVSGEGFLRAIGRFGGGTVAKLLTGGAAYSLGGAGVPGALVAGATIGATRLADAASTAMSKNKFGALEWMVKTGKAPPKPDPSLRGPALNTNYALREKNRQPVKIVADQQNLIAIRDSSGRVIGYVPAAPQPAPAP